MTKRGNGNDKSSSSSPRSLISAPPATATRGRNERLSSTQDAMDELLDETFNSDSLEESYSLVGLEEPEDAVSSETAVLAGPTSPEACAKRYKKLRTDNRFWDELERVEDDN
jgi:hypothetical protein